MQITIDRTTDTATIQLTRGEPTAIAETFIADPLYCPGAILLNFDDAGQLVSIIVEQASESLPGELLVNMRSR